VSNHARKMLEWGDKCVGFQQQHEVAGWVQPTAAVRFYLGAPDHVEVAFSTTVTFGGGVQHSADGSIVLSRAHASELGAALLGDSAEALLNSYGWAPSDAAQVAEGINQIRDQVLNKSRSGVKIAAAEIADQRRTGRLGPSDYVRRLQQADQLREILETRPGEGAALRDWENWSRVAGKLMEGLK
jgi:hypothetical protein